MNITKDIHDSKLEYYGLAYHYSGESPQNRYTTKIAIVPLNLIIASSYYVWCMLRFAVPGWLIRQSRRWRYSWMLVSGAAYEYGRARAVIDKKRYIVGTNQEHDLDGYIGGLVCHVGASTRGGVEIRIEAPR